MTLPESTRLPALPALLLAGVGNCWRRKDQVQPVPGFSRHFAVSGIDLAHIERYRRFFDFRRSTLPLTYFYLLAQRAQLALMLDRRFPHAIAGLIHSANELRRHAIPRADSNLEIQVSLLPTGDTHKVTFTVEVTQAGRSVLSGSSEYRLPGKRRRLPGAPVGPEEPPESFVAADWQIEKSLIRRYALLAGDYNPIHLSAMLARHFGFSGAIAHGMYVVARAAATIENGSSQPLTAISAVFRRPIPLPARAVFGCQSLDAMQGAYSVFLPDDKRLAVHGLWETAPA